MHWWLISNLCCVCVVVKGVRCKKRSKFIRHFNARVNSYMYEHAFVLGSHRQSCTTKCKSISVLVIRSFTVSMNDKLWGQITFQCIQELNALPINLFQLHNWCNKASPMEEKILLRISIVRDNSRTEWPLINAWCF